MPQSTMGRIMGALTFRQGVYESVEKDPTFSSTAWTIVAVVAFLSQLGSQGAGLRAAFDAGTGAFSVVAWIVLTIVGTVIALIAFAVYCAVVAWVGRMLFKAPATFDEMVRTLGLANIWNIFGVLGILGVLVPGLLCIASPVFFIAFILALVAGVLAAKAALDLDWGPAIITIVIGGVISFVISGLIGGVINAAIMGALT
jgi:hypothetical protein